jgi:tRNA1(Val) A37 N6-methylase TrmN6
MLETMIKTGPTVIAGNADGVDRGLRAIGGVRVTRDAFLGGALRLYQPERGYRAGIDAVLLAASLDVGEETRRDGGPLRVADLGAGVGTAGLCLAARTSDLTIDLVEREPELSEIARHNILANGYAERVRPVTVDLIGRAATEALGVESYDHVIANPPFYRASDARAPADPLKAASHVFGADDLDGWLRCMARITRPGGQATVIYPAEALGDLLNVFAARFGGLTVTPLHPRNGLPAIRVLVSGRKGSRAPLSISPPIFLHEEGSAFRSEISSVLNAPRSLAAALSSKA